MFQSDISLDPNQLKGRILQLEAELNYVKSELAHTGDTSYSLTCAEYIQLMLDTAFEGLIIHSDFIIVDVNRAICEIWGGNTQNVAKLRDELIGKNILEFVSAEFIELVKTNIINNYSKSYEVRGIRRDGGQFPIETQGKTIEWRRQNVRVTAIRDISDRKLTELALLDVEKIYQTLFDHKSDSVFIYGFTETGLFSNFIEVNDTACTSLGYSRAELLEMSPSSIIPKDFSFDKELMAILLTQKYANQEILLQTKDGKIFPVELSLSKVETSEGKSLAIGFARDISDRKATEAALIEGEKRYQALFTSNSEAVFIHSFTEQGNPSNFIEVNDAACASLGYSRDELLQLSPREIIPKDYRAPFNIPQKLTENGNATFEAFHLTKDGRVFPVEVRTVLLDNTESNLVIDFARDISDRKALEAKLERLASMDYLTQVANRRQFDQYLEAEWRRGYREQTYLSLIMADIDYFKLYNDCYGHQVGDKCLQQVAGAIASCMKRPADLVARYGGEEFGIILPMTNVDGAVYMAETIRTAIKNLAIPHDRSTINPLVTMSLGIASFIPTSEDFAILIEAADHALYNAKRSGRDRFYKILDSDFRGS